MKRDIEAMKVEWTIPSSELEGQDQHAATLSNKGYASVSAGLGSYRGENIVALCTPSLCIHIHDIIQRPYK
ncbi:uncharacterized protein Bfra_007259 [Botrytis fragariae]|uniref:Uncharacterized protein n=1 Tax=Botrytis fragariae TaxID=1964551 RepID=A0A8H6EDA9_9HELO|nr:uncharacterized protein Bfra_007259 [Botrytis fragariae]KAF5868064.1 hypothetical protein Bfra_007259 [Botrytis fragariae]